MKTDSIRLAIAQINSTVGDLKGNCKKIAGYLQKATALNTDIAIFPELAITGYPPEDLLLKPKFIADNLEALKEVAAHVGETIAVVGFVDRADTAIYNAAAVIHKARVRAVYHKMLLPNYGVFDEKRYFTSGSKPSVFRFGETIFGITICEDMWHRDGPVKIQAGLGAGLLINLNASPYYMGRIREREDVARNNAKTCQAVIAYTNLVGGQDELVFDGQSMIIDAGGKIIARAEAFKEDLLIADLEIKAASEDKLKAAFSICDKQAAGSRSPLPKKEIGRLDETAEIYQALQLGLADYVNKNNFHKVVIGLSGGIDSSLVAALASDALGKENVTGIFMPTRYSSEQSERDARELASNLGITFVNISIDHIYKLYLISLEQVFAGREKDITEENLQARIRGNILMALSNKFGSLVLTTGNKSEMSTGYATLYGDMAGGLAVIKDVPKTLVYKLAKYRNSLGKVIPDSAITREPTAELRPEQKDRDTLPDYKILDPIVKAYVEDDKSPGDIIAMGFDREIVLKSVGMVDNSEYKRRQSPPGIKITPKAFGRDRRMPITNRYYKEGKWL